MHRLAAVLAAGLCLGGCADPSAGSNNDPYENTNREVFAFNQRLDRIALRPAAERYVKYVPEGVRDSIRNALGNLDTPAIFANDMLQGRGKDAGATMGRFLLNSTFGVAGLFDVGAHVGIAAHHSDFGQTLAVWGVEDGPYMMMPMLGPMAPRDGTGQIVDFAMDPMLYIAIPGHYYWIFARKYVSIVDTRARNLEALDEIERDSLDFYAATRSLYRQYRENEIRNGTPPP